MADFIIILLGLIGLILSLYAYYIEKQIEKNRGYKAICDISEKISCTKTITSGYGKLFVISNSLYGIGFYLFIIALSFFEFSKIIFYVSVLSMLGTLYLAYIQYFKVKTFCLLCNGIYAVNIMLIWFSYSNL